MNTFAAQAAAEIARMASAFMVSRVVHVCAELGVADALGAEALTADDLAGRIGCDALALARLLRCLEGLGIVRRATANRYALTEAGALLRGDVTGSVRSLVGALGETCWPAWDQLAHSIRTGAPAFDAAFGRDYFDYLASEPAAEATYYTANIDRVAAETVSFDFSPFETVIDVGGGDGNLMLALLERYPRLRGVLFDRETAITRARHRFGGADLGGRCTLVAGDFFAGVPGGGDAYILQRVLNDWDDEHALQILRSCRAAMSGSARLIIVELPLEDGPGLLSGALQDLQVLVMHPGARQRRLEEIHALCAEVGLATVSSHGPVSGVYMLEYKPVPIKQTVHG
jgi:hypothetical protein